MSKARTIEAIEMSATEIFCRDGYDRASLREIASCAGVPLSSIHEYFESKADLYLKAGRRIFEHMEAEKLELLEEARNAGELDLETVLHCIISPMISSKFRGASAETYSGPHLKTWYETSDYLHDQPKFREELKLSIEHWIRLIAEYCPGLGASDARLAYCQISATLFSWDRTNSYIDQALQIPGRFSPEEECRMLVTSISAGIRELARRSAGA